MQAGHGQYSHVEGTMRSNTSFVSFALSTYVCEEWMSPARAYSAKCNLVLDDTYYFNIHVRNRYVAKEI